MITLRDLNESYMNIMTILDNPEADQEALIAALNEINETADEKIVNIIKVIKEYEDRNKAIKEEKARLGQLETINKNAIERLKDYAKQSMLLRNQKKIVSDLYTITLANNQPKVNVLDETKIPLDFFEEVREMKLDKKALKEYLKNNECDYAYLESKQSLRIK
ncbi:siphovirus Gp157 family protein [Enterococcus cecorum]|uniref:siphovirus Gp157 family protein n=1 Tax=Enterococcus cecorum TaxID=44008 RepID=UPI000642ECFB|nr:siphovirus Gp157 family protein [Enterococcus cecorum]KLO70097.1 hypothetical protein AA988_07210 [Enterococcus cecorum]CAI3363137.1 siphovirus Gp157 family protein [Enterococcus cecorum]